VAIRLRRVVTAAIGIILLFEAAVTAFNIYTRYIVTDFDPARLYSMLGIPPVLLFSGVLMWRGGWFWPLLLPVVYLVGAALYIATTESGSFSIPWPVGA
jgi:hypothetical protein